MKKMKSENCRKLSHSLKVASLEEGDSITRRYILLKEVGKGVFGSFFKDIDRSKLNQGQVKSDS